MLKINYQVVLPVFFVMLFGHINKVYSQIVIDTFQLDRCEAFNFDTREKVFISIEECTTSQKLTPLLDSTYNEFNYDIGIRTIISEGGVDPDDILRVYQMSRPSSTIDSCIAPDSNYYSGDVSIIGYFITHNGLSGKIEQMVPYSNRFSFKLQLDGSKNLCGPLANIGHSSFSTIKSSYQKK